MTSRSRRHPPKPTAADLAKLNRLVIRALKLAEKPLDEGRRLSLQRSADVAFRACLPVGHQHRANPFLAVINLGKTWFRLSEDDRRARADALRTYAQACEAALAEPAAGGRRADIDG